MYPRGQESVLEKLESLTKVNETNYIFIKKVHKMIFDLRKGTRNPPFHLTQCCAKPEKALPGVQTGN